MKTYPTSQLLNSVFLAVAAVCAGGAGFAVRAAETGPVSAVEDQVFVRWSSLTQSEQEAYHARLGAHSVWHSTLVDGLERVVLNDGIALEGALAFYRALPAVDYAEPVRRVHRTLPPMHALPPPMSPFSEGADTDTAGVPTDPRYGEQWALNGTFGILPLDAWKVSRGSKDVKVAIIDTGISLTHPELQGKVLPGYDFIDRTDQVYDHHGHGTHVSGIIGANTDNGIGIAGINSNVSLIPIRAIPSDDDETDANVIEAFEFAVQQGARVANCSFGKADSSLAVGQAIAAAGEQGLLAVIAAGNDGQDINRNPTYPASFQTPNSIVVASISKTGGLSFFSNYGDGKVDLAAPGSNILSTVAEADGYASWSGTSMATPQVVGAAALLLAVRPELTPAQLKDLLLSTVHKEAGLQGRVSTGGRLDLSAAVQKATGI